MRGDEQGRKDMSFPRQFRTLHLSVSYPGSQMIESALSVSPGKHEEEQEQVVSLLSGSKEPNICALTPKFSGG